MCSNVIICSQEYAAGPGPRLLSKLKDWASECVHLEIQVTHSLITCWRLLLAPPVRLREPFFQIALRSHLLHTLLTILRFPVTNHITRDGFYLDMVQRMAKVCYTIPIIALPFWENNSVHGTLEQSIRPEMHQIPDVDEDGSE